ncbi:class I SAM-dependent methyltransferase [Halodesulfovibrio marinisediminis]|uniref:Methyltransferase domain-containing protein n=1 Tax=Halodesulfovibrio marinisediminis DSM 17456 TaxID=1121457 RepID=A0A1N6I2H1_9BACT|nr:class I SAM-dependent methyltransferase [Halodesulfovibrio marinisediminis]SIO26222.1 Methyltransferase domain-containing protein [Halodesulfovibrio marinisediminis DSM 17456]
MEYYNNYALEYSEKTLPIDMSEQYDRFLRTLPKNGFILDAGCGSGRDALYFLKKGYQVDAFDASEEMARLAGELTGLTVKCMRFQDFKPHPIYDGIWASASLLHVPFEELHDVLTVLRQSLKPGGTLYCSFKYGIHDSVDSLGRHFTNRTCETLDKDLVNAGFTGRRSITIEHSTTPEGTLQEWVSALAIAP